MAILSEILPYAPGAINIMVGGGLSVTTQSSQLRKKTELAYLQKIKANIEASRENLNSSKITSISSSDIDFSAIQTPSELVLQCFKILGNKPISSSSVLRLTSPDKEIIALVLDIYEKIILKRIESEKGSSSIDKRNVASCVAQGLSGVGQVAAQSIKAGTAHALAASAASGFSFFSSVFFLGASLKGMYSSSNELSKNKTRQGEILDVLNKLGNFEDDPGFSNLPSATKESFKAETAIAHKIIASENQRLKKELEHLKKEGNRLEKTYYYHCINALGAFFCVMTSVLFIIGMPGASIIIYYAAMLLGSLLPLAAMAYQASTAETVDQEKQAEAVRNDDNELLQEGIAHDERNILKIKHPAIEGWLRPKLAANIALFLETQDRDTIGKINALITHMMDKESSYDQLLRFLSTLFYQSVSDENDSIARAQGLQASPVPV